MTRRNIIRVLLSLLLLLSQQMAISHGMTHWFGPRDAAAQLQPTPWEHQEAGISSAFAQDETCSHCLAFAQIAGVISTPVCGYATEDAGSCAPAIILSQPGCTRTSCVFQPRGPPSLA
jgi:hypothetical protein